MKIKAGTFCPLIKGECKKLECVWFTQIAGTHPQTGEQFDEWGCAVAWIPFLQVDNSKAVNQQGAAVESFRNETLNLLRPVVTLRPTQENKLIDVNETNYST